MAQSGASRCAFRGREGILPAVPGFLRGTANLECASPARHAPAGLEVTVLRSKELGVIGVGEGSTVGLPSYLHGLLKIDQGEFLRRAAPIWKLGLRFIEWGPRGV